MSNVPEIEPAIQIGKWVLGRMVPARDDKQAEYPSAPYGLKELPTYTDITILLDRSGSMGHIRQATVAGINNFMRSIDEVPGEGCWTLVTFDDHDSASGAGEQFPHFVFKGVATQQRPLLELNNYIPRGGTALVDAFYAVISDLKIKISSLTPQQRASRKILIVVMTDGQENRSRSHNSSDLRKLIAGCQAAGWEFLYLGANQDAFVEAAKYGIDQQRSPFFGLVQTSWEATPEGAKFLYEANNRCSATFGARSWKLDGNESAVSLQGDSSPDKKS